MLYYSTNKGKGGGREISKVTTICVNGQILPLSNTTGKDVTPHPHPLHDPLWLMTQKNTGGRDVEAQSVALQHDNYEHLTEEHRIIAVFLTFNASM